MAVTVKLCVLLFVVWCGCISSRSSASETHLLNRHAAEAPRRPSLTFELREDGRCLVFEMDRPGDFVACSFSFEFNNSISSSSHEASLWRRLSSAFASRNVTVDVFSPSWKEMASYSFAPQHPCAKQPNGCLVRSSPLAVSGAAHGVEVGSYYLCFRKTSLPSSYAALAQQSEDVSKWLDGPVVLRLLNVITTAGRSKQAAADIMSTSSVNRAAKYLTSMYNDVESVKRETLLMLERQEEFRAVTDSIAFRAKVGGAATVIVMAVVSWAQYRVLRGIILKKKLV